MKFVLSIIFVLSVSGIAYADDPRIMLNGGPLCSSIWAAQEADDMFLATHDFDHFPKACRVAGVETKVELIAVYGNLLKVFTDGKMMYTTDRYALDPLLVAELKAKYPRDGK